MPIDRLVRTRAFRVGSAGDPHGTALSRAIDLACVETERDGNEVVSVSHSHQSDMPGRGHHWIVVIAYAVSGPRGRAK